MYLSEKSSWDEERIRIAERKEKAARRAEARAAIDKLPTLSQRLIGRLTFIFTR